MDAVYPDTGFDLAPQRAAIGVMGADSLKTARQIRNPIDNNGDILSAFDGITYRKGGGVLSMFETYLGEDNFRDGMRLHMRRFEDGVADVNDFMASLAEGSGNDDVVESFKSFILQPGIPYLNVALSCPAPDAGLLTVTQTRYAPLGSEIDTDAQTWTVPFAARLSGANGDRTIRQMLTEKTTELALDGGCPDWVMPNAGGSGYWRFNMDEASWKTLIANYEPLSEGEQLTFADSVTAAFAAGEVSAETMLNAIEVNANGYWGAAGDPLGNLTGYLDALPEEADKDAMNAFIADAYADRWAYLSARDDDALSQGEQLLKNSLYGVMLAVGAIDADRAALAEAAKAYIGMEGEPDRSALAPNDVSRAISFATEAGDSAFYQAALDYAKTTQNQRERRSILSILARNASEADMLDLMTLVQGDDFQGQEAWSVSLAALSNDNGRDAAWEKLKADFDAIITKTPEIRKPQTAGLVRNFCEADALAEAIAFVESNTDLMPGYERPLAQATESAELCVAFRAAKGEELAEALRAR